jgi:protein TonB
MSNVLTLAEIIRRGVSLDWPEGVALIRSVIERMTTMPGQAPAIPELYHIELGDTGRVEVTGGQTADEPVRRMGQLLQATLGHAEPPVQLRLVISQATAPSPQFSSIREFDEVLGYYERPGREGVLKALYERAAAAPPVAASAPTPAPTIDRIAPLPTRESAKPRRLAVPPEEKRRRRRLAVVAVILLALIGAGVQYIRVTGSAERDAQLAAIAAKASSVVGDAVVTGLSAVTENVGLGRLVTEPTLGPEAPVPSPSAPEAAPARGSSPRPAVPSEIVSVAVFDLNPEFAPVLREPVAGTSAAAAVASPSTTPAAAADASAAVEIFTPVHQDVVPPVGIRPQLPRELPRDIRLEDLARVELVVAADGTVETVKLVSSPRDVHDSMWLSAMKAWQFQPALRNGVPVRYLKTVWLAPR